MKDVKIRLSQIIHLGTSNQCHRNLSPGGLTYLHIIQNLPFENMLGTLLTITTMVMIEKAVIVTVGVLMNLLPTKFHG